MNHIQIEIGNVDDTGVVFKFETDYICTNVGVPIIIVDCDSPLESEPVLLGEHKDLFSLQQHRTDSRRFVLSALKDDFSGAPTISICK